MAKKPGESESRSSTTSGSIRRTVSWTSGAAEDGAETEGKSGSEAASETHGNRADESWAGIEPTPREDGDAPVYTVTIAREASDGTGQALARQSWTVTAATATAIGRLIEQDAGSPGASVWSESGGRSESRSWSHSTTTRITSTVRTTGAAEGGAETEGESWTEEMPEPEADVAGADSPEYRPRVDADKKKPGAGAPGGPPEAGSDYYG
jgi:hypothetical protein